MKLRKVLFWDTEIDKLDWKKNDGFIMSRVAMYGNWAEWNEVLSYYGVERIKRKIRQLRYLDNKTLNYLSLRFKIPKEEFRCYTSQHSSHPHFPF